MAPIEERFSDSSGMPPAPRHDALRRDGAGPVKSPDGKFKLTKNDPKGNSLRITSNEMSDRISEATGYDLELAEGFDLVLRIEISQNVDSTASNGESLREVERGHIVNMLERTGWRIKGKCGAAEILGIKTTTLYSPMKKLGITRPPK